MFLMLGTHVTIETCKYSNVSFSFFEFWAVAAADVRNILVLLCFQSIVYSSLFSSVGEYAGDAGEYATNEREKTGRRQLL